MRNRLLVILFFLFVCFSLQAQVSFGEAKNSMTTGCLVYRMTAWVLLCRMMTVSGESLDLPHDWSVEGQFVSFTGKLYRLFAGWDRLVSETFSGY